MKRNNLNVDQVESLVYVHYKLTLLSHYCDATKNDRTYLTWDNNPEEADLKDLAKALERLDVELLGDQDGDQIHTTKMPHPQLLVGFQM